MLDIAGYDSEKSRQFVSLLEPGAGDGAFLLPVLERLHESSERFSFSFVDSLQNLIAVDIDADMVHVLRARVQDYLLRKGVRDGVRYSYKIVRHENFFFSTCGHFDIVVGNPPYVRHELIPDGEKTRYRNCLRRSETGAIYISRFSKSRCPC